MKICLLTRSHKPCDPRLHYRIARSLSRLGFEVFVVCRLPHGSSRLVERIDKIQYTGIPKFRTPGLDFLKTITLYREARRIRAKIYICFELRTLFIGLIFKILENSKIIYDCHEYRAESYSELVPKDLRGPMIWMVSSLEKILAKLSDRIWCVNKDLGRRIGANGKSPIVLPNYPLKELFMDIRPLSQEIQFRLKGRKILIYVGNISEKRGISACLRMMSHLKTLCPESYFLFIGNVPRAYQQRIDLIIKEYDLTNHVEFKGFVDHSEIPSYLKLGDLGVFMVLPVIQVSERIQKNKI